MAEMLSQDEINALLGNANSGSSESDTQENAEDLTKAEVDVLTEIGTETMNVSANTLANNLRREVTISDPVVEKMFVSSAKNKFEAASLGVRIEYKDGVKGSNVLVLGYKDAKIIANLMQGGDGNIDEEDQELSMIDESALCEAMNQMVGSSSTILFKILGEKVDIDTPKLFNLNLEDEQTFINDFGFNEDFECIISTFALKVSELIDSQIIQIMPIEFAQKLINSYSNNEKPETVNSAKKELEEFDKTHTNQDMNAGQNMGMQQPNMQMQQPMNMGMAMGMQPNMQMGMQQNMDFNNQMAGGMQMQYGNNNNNMNAKPAQFQSFDINEVVQQKENINIIMDVPLEVTVEMGRTVRRIEEILEFSPGTIIELDKLAGDPIDILVNGKFVAKGEVVVIDENYGIRITDIINFKNRI